MWALNVRSLQTKTQTVRERNAVIKQIAESSEWQHYLSPPEAWRENVPQ